MEHAPMSAPLLSLWNRLSRWPAGGWLFSRAICFKAPYFGSISPCITRLEAGRCQARIADRRAVGTLQAEAVPGRPLVVSAEGYDLPVQVTVTDPRGETVFVATIAMWVSPRPARR